MRFIETQLRGAYVIELDRIEDERGFFARSFCRREFESRGLDADVVQCNVSHNRRRGTLRGMHFQRTPCREAKLVRCTAGAVFDAIVDLRPDSPTFLRHAVVEMSAENRRMIYIPECFAHGFLTLEDDTEVFYQMSEYYVAEAACGIRWNDPTLSIEWPAPVAVISPRDAAYPNLQGTGDERLAQCMDAGS